MYKHIQLISQATGFLWKKYIIIMYPWFGKKLQTLKNTNTKNLWNSISLDNVKSIWDFDVLKGQNDVRQKLQKKGQRKILIAKSLLIESWYKMNNNILTINFCHYLYKTSKLTTIIEAQIVIIFNWEKFKTLLYH